MSIKTPFVLLAALLLAAESAAGQNLKVNEVNLGAPDLISIANFDVAAVNLTGYVVRFWEDLQVPAGLSRTFAGTESVVTPGGPVMIMPGEEITIDDAPGSNSPQTAPGSQTYYWNGNITFNLGEAGAAAILTPGGAGLDIIGHDNGNGLVAGALAPLLPAVPASGTAGVIGIGVPMTTFTSGIIGAGTGQNAIQRVGLVDTNTAADLINTALGTPGSVNLGQQPPNLLITSPGGNFAAGDTFSIVASSLTPGAPYVLGMSIGGLQLPGISIPGSNPAGQTVQLDLATLSFIIDGFAGSLLGTVSDPTGTGVPGTGLVSLSFGIPPGLSGAVRTFQVAGLGPGGVIDLTNAQAVTFN